MKNLLNSLFTQKVTAFLLTAGLLASCESELSMPKTDLGTANVEVAARINKNLAAARVCVPTSTRPRVIVSGFAPFNGLGSTNISGIVVNSMAKPDFWPESILLDTSTPDGQVLPQPAPNALSEYLDVAGTVRLLAIDAQLVEVCFLELSVRWDVAGPILLEETKHFDAQVVVMMGSGKSSITFEAGALNRVVALTDFDPLGLSTDVQPLASNSPVLPLSTPGLRDPIAVTWDSIHLARLTQAYAPASFETEGLLEADVTNNYICNNTTFLVLSGLAGIPLSLAGGQVALQYPARTTRAGFIHLPADITTDANNIFALGKLVAATVKNTIGLIGTETIFTSFPWSP